MRTNLDPAVDVAVESGCRRGAAEGRIGELLEHVLHRPVLINGSSNGLEARVTFYVPLLNEVRATGGTRQYIKKMRGSRAGCSGSQIPDALRRSAIWP